MTQAMCMENTLVGVPEWTGLRASLRTIVAMVLSSMMVAGIFAGFAGCMSAVSNPQDPPVVVIDVKEAGSTADLPEYPPEPMLCVRRDRIVLRLDGGSIEYETPRPCLPLWKYRELGDPQP